MDVFLTIKSSPLFTFTLLLAVSVLIPPLIERLRLPGLVGLLAAGVVLGPNGLQMLDHKTETMQLLSEIGKIYLMFVAGLEVDLEQFHRTRNRSLGFGFLTFIIPMVAGLLVGRAFGFGWNASVLIGSLLASHTLLAYPIVSRLGVVANEAVTVTIGATIVTDTAALLVLAMCAAVNQGEMTPLRLVELLGGVAIYSVVVLWGFERAGHEYFRRTGDDRGNQFLFVLLAVFLASVGAQVVGIERIVGAFLAGLAVNRVLGDGPVKEKVEFVGSVLFVPFFFIDMGLLLDLPAIASSAASLGLAAAIVVALIGSKFFAAWGAKLLYRYSWTEAIAMWSLSLPQVAATLAAAIVGVQLGIVDSRVFNAVVVLMLVTSILGPVITTRAASRLTLPKGAPVDDGEILWAPPHPLSLLPGDTEEERGLCRLPFTIVVPLANPLTASYSLQMAAILARYEEGQIVPLAVVRSPGSGDEPEVDAALRRARQLLAKATAYVADLEVPVRPVLRLDDDVARGIARVGREQTASLVVMGWGTESLRSRLFGSTIDETLATARCPVAVVRLADDPQTFQRVLVAVKDLEPKARRAMRFAQIFAAANGAHLIALHACAPQTPPSQMIEMREGIGRAIAEIEPAVSYEVQVIPAEDPARAIAIAAKGVDLVVLRSVRRRTAAGLVIGDVTTAAIPLLTCSLVMFGEPHS